MAWWSLGRHGEASATLLGVSATMATPLVPARGVVGKGMERMWHQPSAAVIPQPSSPSIDYGDGNGRLRGWKGEAMMLTNSLGVVATVATHFLHTYLAASDKL